MLLLHLYFTGLVNVLEGHILYAVEARDQRHAMGDKKIFRAEFQVRIQARTSGYRVLEQAHLLLLQTLSWMFQDRHLFTILSEYM